MRLQRKAKPRKRRCKKHRPTTTTRNKLRLRPRKPTTIASMQRGIARLQRIARMGPATQVSATIPQVTPVTATQPTTAQRASQIATAPRAESKQAREEQRLLQLPEGTSRCCRSETPRPRVYLGTARVPTRTNAPSIQLAPILKTSARHRPAPV